TAILVMAFTVPYLPPPPVPLPESCRYLPPPPVPPPESCRRPSRCRRLAATLPPLPVPLPESCRYPPTAARPPPSTSHTSVSGAPTGSARCTGNGCVRRSPWGR